MRWLAEGDPELAPSDDPARSTARVAELTGEGRSSWAPSQQRTLDAIGRHGAAVASRTTAPAHLTASAVVVDPSRRRVLVLHHAKLRRWLQPGGHADGDHELAGVALREAREETGISGLAVLLPAFDLDVHEVDHGDALGAHEHLDLRFLVAAPPGARERGNHESTELRWVDERELAELTDEARLLDAVRRGLALARVAPPPPRGWLS
ncbi:MAG TPA: NUDIX hydrolase [Microthrixaceae bacterium]|nr:NUDIX hydrolase [Microthrixaceae bacterium]